MNTTMVLDDGLGNVVAHIVTNYLASFYTICVFWHLNNFDHIVNSFMQNIPMNNLHSNDFRMIYPTFHLYKFNDIDDQSKIILSAVNDGCQAFIISTDTSDNFMNAYFETSHLFFQRNSQNPFVFVPSINTKSEKTNDILNHAMAIDLPNLIIITRRDNDNHIYDLISSKFVGRYNNTAPILLNSYDSLSQTFINDNQNLFPNKLLNLEGRSVRLGLMNYKPYTVWIPTEPGLGNANLIGSGNEKDVYVDGIEVLVFIEFCAKFNCTLEVWAANAEDWGGTFLNGSGNGLLGAIAERKVDAGVAALYLWFETYRDLDLSNTLMRASIIILAPKPLLLPQWKLPSWPFSRSLWFAVFISFAVNVISLVFVDYFIDLSKNTEIPKRRVNMNDIIFEVTAVLLGQSSSDRQMIRTTEMIVMGCMLLISMIVDSAYTGGLASIMAIPRYEEPIDSIHQLAAKGWEWGSNAPTWINSIRLAQQADVVRLIHLYKSLEIDELKRRLHTKDFSYVMENLQSGHFSLPDYINQDAMDNLRLMRDYLYYDYTTVFVYKTWPLLTTLNPLLSEITQSGLPIIWEFAMSLKYLDNNLQLRVLNSRSTQDDDMGPEPINTEKLLGAFGLLVVGNSIAFFILLCEIIFERYVKKSVAKAKSR